MIERPAHRASNSRHHNRSTIPMKRFNSLAMTGAALALLAFTGAARAMSAVPDWNVAGIPDAGFAHFQNGVKVTFAKNGSNWKLTAANNGGSQLFQTDPSHAYSLSKTSFVLTANFNSSLNFTGGNMELKGKIPGLGVNSVISLWKTSLSGFGVDMNPFDGSPFALGFATSGHSGWASRYANGSPESVYLFAPNLATLAFKLFNHQGLSMSVNATALTTVPVPAAVWLLGSALIGLFGARRKGTTVTHPTPPLLP
jgi:hypothetical protein